ncbi:hypothetical protein MBM_04922 [Drepanopeziza brunnea f. sp. 'multigermtubi' MB_m1]|uniref:Uncharacterized protein n=1 Tax=Marssonina brunnea f. sp. multigermtubi (strain MB_m1) TaxID=1072389 RepID=K1X716_MARBU|nr:uncharacterized protein MBM_04922 [Drepanopeziza brunnea f. sp. 'multigermtubi' MB_m1]EKD16453.1 hypothetical protein MBM_04922 [Drepanopeziza brunnea f. sp. 'multigermtubi' MB_m1]
MAALAPVTLLLLRKTQDVFCNIFLRQLRSDPAFSEGTSSLIPASCEQDSWGNGVYSDAWSRDCSHRLGQVKLRSFGYGVCLDWSQRLVREGGVHCHHGSAKEQGAIYDRTTAENYTSKTKRCDETTFTLFYHRSQTSSSGLSSRSLRFMTAVQPPFKNTTSSLPIPFTTSETRRANSAFWPKSALTPRKSGVASLVAWVATSSSPRPLIRKSREQRVGVDTVVNARLERDFAGTCSRGAEFDEGHEESLGEGCSRIVPYILIWGREAGPKGRGNRHAPVDVRIVRPMPVGEDFD